MNIDKEQSHDDNEDIFLQGIIKTTTNRISYLSNLIKVNIAIIVLIPTVLGGLIQLFKLGMIDLRYIRYFSVTQLVPDGLLAILLLWIIAAIVYIHNNFLLIKLSFIPEKLTTKLKLRSLISSLVIATGQAISITYAVVEMPSTEELLNSSNYFIAVNAVIYVGILAMVFYCFKYINLEKEYLRNIDHVILIDNKLLKISKSIFSVFSSILLVSFIVIFLRITYFFIEYMNEAKGTYNYSKIEEIISNDFESYTDYKILYFNDKYTFVNIIEGRKNFTIIYKTDNVFFNPTTIEIQ
ncbi:hypothetical protein SC65A3_01450 [Psychrobacter sp. SC65A.3]|uniref:hypothetical protein n=1 Tax=Psychrobacter sp. SC65A.3 TaxID=2983299 RepID=UPI0021DB5AA6|nr:hypothetical protein [Psychrobacter sp. SC65A.3]WAI87987.1 hypothetical protein SC65A3_01450 [Psychrobacter sp. SC65A.3]|tara:strand:+ start:436 stop:1323 length:888 start_codon:yes stop_codon:yes gene_type:complete